jgi:hypothetical protein
VDDRQLAHVAAFTPNENGASPAFTRMAVMIQIVNASPTLNESAFTTRQDLIENASLRVIGRRLGVPVDHPAVRLVADTWTVVFASAFRGWEHAARIPSSPAFSRPG